MEIFKKLTQLELDSKEYGFYWPNTASVIEQIKSEVIEVEELLQDKNHSKKHLQEEIGDLIHAVFSLCLYCNYDPKITLNNSLEKFKKRYKKVKELALKDGLMDLRNTPIEKSMQYWHIAKNKEEL
jgi:uncharacterized protein YabN with tetrapyrrole methylase and pyrophosphatase domain